MLHYTSYTNIERPFERSCFTMYTNAYSIASGNIVHIVTEDWFNEKKTIVRPAPNSTNTRNKSVLPSRRHGVGLFAVAVPDPGRHGDIDLSQVDEVQREALDHGPAGGDAEVVPDSSLNLVLLGSCHLEVHLWRCATCMVLVCSL